MMILHHILFIFSRLVLQKYKPDSVFIMGSQHKDFAKVFLVKTLSSQYSLRQSVESPRHLLGVCYTVLGVSAPGTSPSRWIKIFFASIKLILGKNISYPQILVFEMDLDRPADIKNLVRLLHPHVVMIISLGPNLESFMREKGEMIKCLAKNDAMILNADDVSVMAMKEKTRARTLAVGFGEQADFFASDMNHHTKGEISFKVHAEGNVIPITLHASDREEVLASLFALAAGRIYGMNFVELGEALRTTTRVDS